MKRATEDHVVKGKEGSHVEGAGLTTFLLNIQEYDRSRCQTRPRDFANPGWSSCLPSSGLEKKTDFEDKKLVEKLLKEVEKLKLKTEAEVTFDEEHSLHEITFGAPASPEDQLGARRLR